MDPNYGGGLDEQNWQCFVEGFESPYQQPQIADSGDPFDSLNEPHFQSGDLGSQSVAGTELPVFPQVPIAGDDRDLSEFLDPARINQDNQAIAGRPQPDLPQGSSENFGELNWLNGFQFGEFGNQAIEQLDAPQVQPEMPRTGRNAYDLYKVNEEPVELGRAPGRSNCGFEGEDLFMGIVNGIQPGISQPHADQPAGSQAAARGQDQDAQKRARKQEVDRAYRYRKKAKLEQLEVENQRLKAEVKALADQNYHLETMISRLRGDNHSVNNQLETLSKKLDWVQASLKFINQPTTQCSGVTGVVNQQQMSITNMQPLLTQMKLLLAGLQNITQLSGAHVYAQPWQSQHNISLSQVSQAATTTLPVTQPDGTSRMQQILQSPGTSHGLPDISPLEQLAQTAHAQTNHVSPVFSLHQGQGRNTAVESQPFTQGLSDQDAKLEEFSSSFVRPRKHRRRVTPEGFIHHFKQEQSIISPFTKGHPAIAASPVAENDPLKPEIQEKQELCHEDQQMKSNIEAFEAEKCRLKLEIGEKEQPMKSNLEAIEAENERLKREIDVKKQQMESNLKAFEAQIRQLVDEFESLNVANVSVNIRTQTQSGEQKGNAEYPQLESSGPLQSPPSVKLLQ